MPVTEEQLREALKQVKYPGFSRDIVSFGLVKGIRIDGATVTVQMALATNEPAIPQAIKTQSETVLRAMPEVETVRVLIDVHAPPAGAGPAGGGGGRSAGMRPAISLASGGGGARRGPRHPRLTAAL